MNLLIVTAGLPHSLDSALREALETAGRELVETAYSWEYSGDPLLRILEEREREFIC